MINLARRLLKGALAFRALRVSAISGHSASTQNDAGMGVAVDSAGNFIYGGYVDAAADYGFVAKFDMASALSWQRKQSFTARFRGASVGLDSSDNVYAAGSGYVTAAPELPVLFKYNSSGALQWQRQLTDASTSVVNGLIVNPAGDSFLTLRISPATTYALLAKYNTSGAIQWQRKLSSTYTVSLYATAFASDGGIIACGGFQDGAPSAANNRGIVVKYDVSGAIQWQYKIHWAASGVWNCVAVDSATGDIYLGGFYTAGTANGAITKLNSAGTHQWTRRHPTSNSFINQIAVDPATGYVFAYVADTLSMLACFDASGTVLWERLVTGDASAAISVFGMTVSNGELLVAHLANHSGASQGNDAVLLRLPTNGGIATTCGYVVITVPTATAYTTPSAPTNVAAGLTDAAGASTDAAGTATDAAGALTFTNYTN